MLLFTDGHKSHINLDVVDLCRQNDIILFCLPPHTTHALQPLDVSVFKSLKDHYAKTVRSLTFAKPSFMVTKREFSKVIRVPFEQSFSITNIKAGFSKCGIYPFNPDAIAHNKMLPSSSDTSTSSGGSVASSPLPIEQSTPLSSQLQCSSSSMPSSASPSPIVSSLDSQNSSGVSCSTPISNPLVRAGLIPPELADILTPLPPTKEPTKRIVGARDLTANEYHEWLKVEEGKKKKKAEEKEKRAEERKRKKEEKQERLNKASTSCKRPSARRQLSLTKGNQENPAQERQEEEETESADEQDEHTSARPKRQRQFPQRYRQSESDSDDDQVPCALCLMKYPPGCRADTLFWVDCDRCGIWVHSFCAFDDNTSSSQFVCEFCAQAST